MNAMKRTIGAFLIAVLMLSMIAIGTISTAAVGSGAGLAEWALRAYREGWSYVWGGDTVGAVDCSGMITSYCGGNRTSMLADAQAHGRDWGYVSDGVPNVHGLGLSRPNHVGVYVGNGMEVDARGDDYDVCCEAVGNRWTCWFKLTAITYPTTGWVKFDGSYYYYENGEYLADTYRTIDGTTYYFANSGISTSDPSSATAKANPSVAETSVNNSPLKKGSQGDSVKKLQERLQALGYYDGAVDGSFGAQTEEAFMLFQETAGLYVDGIAGSDAELLYSADAPLCVSSLSFSTLSQRESTVTGETLSTSFKLADSPDDNSDSHDDTDSGQGGDHEDNDAASEEDESVSAPAQSYAAGDSGEMIVTIQNQLIKLGYLSSDADGAFGPITETAVREFQSMNALEDTGVIDAATYEAIFSLDAVNHTDNSIYDAASPAAAAAATTAGNTLIERENAAISEQSVASVSTAIGSRRAANTNLEFIVWLAIVIIVMVLAFVLVFSVEKKRAGTLMYTGRRFQ